MIIPKFRQGQRLRCTVTGFIGIAESITTWLNGCVRVGLKGPIDKDGKVPDVEVFDEQQLEFVDVGISDRLDILAIHKNEVDATVDESGTT